MTTDNAIAVLQRMQEPDPFEPQITQVAFDALEMAIQALSAKGDMVYRQAAIDAECEVCQITPKKERGHNCTYYVYGCKEIECLRALPSAQPYGYVKVPETGIDDLSDGFHTFRQLYYQRMMLFAAIVKQNKDRAWKSFRHEDGELCFGGGWFIVGIDTPEGSYTYHYEDNYFSLFDCEELECGKHWDGHTEKDVIRLLSLPSEQIRCKDCAKREHCRTSTVWAIPPEGDWYCADAERRTDGQDD